MVAIAEDDALSPDDLLDAIADQPGRDQARIAEMIAYDRATIGGVMPSDRANAAWDSGAPLLIHRLPWAKTRSDARSQ